MSQDAVRHVREAMDELPQLEVPPPITDAPPYRGPRTGGRPPGSTKTYLLGDLPEPPYVYAVQVCCGVKVGRASSPERLSRRVSQLQQGHVASVTVVAVLGVEDDVTAERSMHKELRRRSLGNPLGNEVFVAEVADIRAAAGAAFGLQVVADGWWHDETVG